MTVTSEVWLDGVVVPYGEASVPVLAHSLHYGGAVFEGVRVYGGEPFRLSEHIERLERSAASMGYELPYTRAELAAAARDVVVRSRTDEGYLRPIAWRGGTATGVAGRDASVHVALATWAWPSPFSEASIARGLRLAWSRWRRPAPDTAPVHAKTSSGYTIGTLAALDAARDGADDALFLTHDGRVADATGANIFLVQDGVLVTPDARDFLGGITRALILAGAADLGLEVDVRDVAPEELSRADEIFVCGTAYEVLPVSRIGDTEVPLGPVTDTVRAWYQDAVRSHGVG